MEAGPSRTDGGRDAAAQLETNAMRLAQLNESTRAAVNEQQ
jgi:hypothetical protein